MRSTSLNSVLLLWFALTSSGAVLTPLCVRAPTHIYWLSSMRWHVLWGPSVSFSILVSVQQWGALSLYEADNDMCVVRKWNVVVIMH